MASSLSNEFQSKSGKDLVGLQSQGISDNIRQLVAQTANEWLNAAGRPVIDEATAKAWDDLLSAWLEDTKLPLIIRKGGLRQTSIRHATGRQLVFSDNSPANWCMAQALLGCTPTLDDIDQALRNGTFPIVMIPSQNASPDFEYRGCLAQIKHPPNLNKLGWKVCHIQPVGLREFRSMAELSLATFKTHCMRLLNPSNMFVIPLGYSGLAEVDDFVDVFRQAARPLPKAALEISSANLPSPYTESALVSGGTLVSYTFDQFATLYGRQLPASALKHRAWWANTRTSHPHANVWLSRGWRVKNVDFAGRTVTFDRISET